MATFCSACGQPVAPGVKFCSGCGAPTTSPAETVPYVAPENQLGVRCKTCGDCSSLLYTHTAKDEYYVCKSRNIREARLRAARGLIPCSNSYILRKKLEPKIDFLLGEKLREPEFLSGVVDEFNAGIQKFVSTAEVSVAGPNRRSGVAASF